jgi:hypothetical protein
MKMADGGLRPAHILQLATDVEARVIVSVAVTNEGHDLSELEPMPREIGRRTAKLPQGTPGQGGCVQRESIEMAQACGVRVYAALPEPRRKGVDASEAKENDGPGVARWRQER